MSAIVKITYFDTAMALIEIGSVRLLTDPVMDDAGSQYEQGPISLEKTNGKSVSPSEIGRIDAVLLSHGQHADNLDNNGRAFAEQVPFVLTTPFSAELLGSANAIGLEPWTSHPIYSPEGEKVSITAVPARHGPAGTEEATGPVTGFIIETPGDDLAPIYFSGDTVLFEGTAEIARRCAPIGLALLNLGRVQLAPMGDLTFSLSSKEAVEYAESLDAKWIAPLHFEGWRHFTEDKKSAAAVFDTSLVASRVKWLESKTPVIFDISNAHVF